MEIYIGQPSVLSMQGGCVSNLEEAYAYIEDPINVFFLRTGWSHKENWLQRYVMQVPYLHPPSRVLSVAFFFTLFPCSPSWRHLRTWSCWSWVIRTSYGLGWIIPLQAHVLNARSSAVKSFLEAVGSLGAVTQQVDIRSLGGPLWVVVWPYLWCDPRLLLCEELPPWCEELHPCDSTMNSALLSHDDGNLWNHEPK